jgi:DNA ligase-1
MDLFTRLYFELDGASGTGAKEAALRRYFAEAGAGDAAWGAAILTGYRVKRAVSSRALRGAAEEVTGFPGWMIDACRAAVGDTAETLALLLPPSEEGGRAPSLREAMEGWVRPMARMDDAGKGRVLREAWGRLTVRALAGAAGVSVEEMAARVMGGVEPTEEAWRELMRADAGAVSAGASAARPYPFFLAQQLPAAEGPEVLGERGQWQAEWKWDGIRAQVVRRGGKVIVWSRGEETIGGAFPELVGLGEALPEGTVLDGEVLAWGGQAGEAGSAEGVLGGVRPAPFAVLQTRLNRVRREARLFEETPVGFLAYDVLEVGGVDVRQRPLVERRAVLLGLVAEVRGGLSAGVLRVSPVVEGATWAALREVRGRSRELGVEGLMLKRLVSAYGVGRAVGTGNAGEGRAGDWWKWKVDPYRTDVVLVAAQPGSGRRAGLYTDYTFAVWSGSRAGEGELVAVAKAYSGLSDAEIVEVDRFVRGNTVGRFGPVCAVKPELVFELAFEGIARSGRHKGGVALRFPRMARPRPEKSAKEADTLGVLEAMIPGDAGDAPTKKVRKRRGT